MRGQTLTKKELVQVGGRPIIWHVMQIFSSYGLKRFILTLGYEAEQIRRYFMENEGLVQDPEAESGAPSGSLSVSFLDDVGNEPWQITMVDTGLHTMKASRISRVKEHLHGDRFFVAYGDDVSSVNLTELRAFHMNHGKMATLTSVQINLEYGVIDADDKGLVTGFIERPRLYQWINGGFFLFERGVLDLIPPDRDVNLEKEVLVQLAEMGELMAFKYTGFWQSMNTMKDNILLEELWRNGAPWKSW